MTRVIGFVAIAMIGLALTGCSPTPFTVSTTATNDEGLLKKEYGASPGEADNLVSFPFTWSNLPAGTKSLALIMLDQSYDNYVHWLAADIDPALGGLKEDASRNIAFPQGTNDSNSGYGYVGPLPPNRHLYVMTVYALSAPTGLKPRFGIDELQTAMEGKILATAELGLPFEPFQE